MRFHTPYTDANGFRNFFHTFSSNLFDNSYNNSRGSKKRKPWWFVLIITLLLMGLYFFFFLPSLSPMGTQLYLSIFIGLVLFWFLMLLFGRRPRSMRSFHVSLVIAVLTFVIPFLGSIIGSPLFRAKSYAKLIHVEEGVFADEVDKIGLDQVPIVDRVAAGIIGEKQMGSMGELVSQFNIAQNYSQVNISGKPVRVSPLEYYDLIKYIGNFRNGIEYYVSVDMTTQEGKLNKLEKPIFYSESDYLLRDLDRHLRFRYPFALLGETNFEIDDEGNAWYVTPKLSKRIAFFNAPDTVGVILTNANSGECIYYPKDEIPQWVDRAFEANTIISQLNYKGLYSGGFINSIFGQKNVTSTTDGYNYISLDGDIYLITGVTSVRADTSNLGFYYVNLRTKEAVFYPCPSATEEAARESASGKVQEKNYVATFPIVLNINDRPVYFMSLKDRSLTAKMFALVDAEQFTDVVVGNSVNEVFKNYYEANPGRLDPAELADEAEDLTIKAITSLVKEGESIYYLQVKENDFIYEADPETLGPAVAFWKEGDKIKVLAADGGEIRKITVLIE